MHIMTNYLPIIFIHKGDSFYLKYALENAKKFNPDSRIILLGDNVTIYPNFVEYFDIAKYSSSASKFRKIYVHRSTNNLEIERFCFERWFILNEFIKKHKIKQFLTCDSDVLLFQNITDDFKHFSKFDLTLANKTSGGFMFVSSPKAIENYCKLTIDLFVHPVEKKLFEKFHKTFLKKKQWGGVNDMMSWEEYYKRNSKIGEITKIIYDATYDAGINSFQNFVMDKKIKKVVFENGLPYCFLKKTNKKIRMKCLHFQGQTKLYMKYFSKLKNNFFIKLKINIIVWSGNNLGKLIPNKLKNKIKILIS